MQSLFLRLQATAPRLWGEAGPRSRLEPRVTDPPGDWLAQVRPPQKLGPAEASLSGSLLCRRCFAHVPRALQVGTCVRWRPLHFTSYPADCWLRLPCCGPSGPPPLLPTLSCRRFTSQAIVKLVPNSGSSVCARNWCGCAAYLTCGLTLCTPDLR